MLGYFKTIPSVSLGPAVSLGHSVNPGASAALALLGMLLGMLLASGTACTRQDSDVRSIEHPVTYMNYGQIAGRVVAVPASPGPGAPPAAEGEEQPASGATLFLLDLAAGKQYLDTLQKSADQSCTERLAGMQSALTGFAQGARGGKGAPTARADQDGYFVFERLEAGAYLVVAEGHVGSTDAIWAQPSAIAQDKATVVKLAQPLLACPLSGH